MSIPASRLFREEVFGPVVGVVRYRDEAEAVRLANAAEFALGGAIWTKDVGRAHRLAHKLEAGVIWINDHHKNDPRSVWGGWGASGYGKENGWDALKSYLRKKSVVTRTEPELRRLVRGRRAATDERCCRLERRLKASPAQRML